LKKSDGKVAVVTGASSGIGEATALALAADGAKIVLVARREDRLKALAEKIKSDTKSDAIIVVADASKYETAEKTVKASLDKWGRLDILVNNAGVMYLGQVDGANVEDWQRMIDINVLGLMYFSHAVIPSMKKQGSGHIINISSVSGRVVSARSAVYSATKFAVNAFSEGLRQELVKDKIRLTTIAPGAVATELTDHITDNQTKENVKNWVKSMQALQSVDIASAVVYAASQPSYASVNEILIRPTEQAV